MKLKAVEAQEKLLRPPLTDIKERIKLYAEEITDDTKAVLFLEYPSGHSVYFGATLERCQIVGILTQLAHDVCEKTDEELNPIGAA